MMIDEFEDHNYRNFERQFIHVFRNSKYWNSRSGLSKAIQDDMLKWKKKLTGGKPFHGTLVNLQNYCDITNLSPNDVLLPSGSSMFATELIEYIAYETAEAIADYVEKNPSVVNGSYSFPLIYATREMILLSMEIYIDNVLERFTNIRFLMTEFAFDAKDYNMCNTYTVIDLDKNKDVIYNLSAPQKNTYSFEKAYMIAKEAFMDRVELGQTTQHQKKYRTLLMRWLPEDLHQGQLFSMFTSPHEHNQKEDLRQDKNLDARMHSAKEKVQFKG